MLTSKLDSPKTINSSKVLTEEILKLDLKFLEMARTGNDMSGMFHDLHNSMVPLHFILVI